MDLFYNGHHWNHYMSQALIKYTSIQRIPLYGSVLDTEVELYKKVSFLEITNVFYRGMFYNSGSTVYLDITILLHKAMLWRICVH